MSDNTEDRAFHAAAIQISVYSSLKSSSSDLTQNSICDGPSGRQLFRKSGAVSALKCCHDPTVYRGGSM